MTCFCSEAGSPLSSVLFISTLVPPGPAALLESEHILIIQKKSKIQFDTLWLFMSSYCGKIFTLSSVRISQNAQ